MSELEMPDDPLFVVTVKWTEHGIFVDTRGVSLPEAYTILQKATDAVYERLDDAYVIADDEDADLFSEGLSALEDEDED